jgi:hypothetical protein
MSNRAENLRNRKDTDASLSTALSSVVTVTEVLHGFSPIPLSFLHPFSCQISPTPSFYPIPGILSLTLLSPLAVPTLSQVSTSEFSFFYTGKCDFHLAFFSASEEKK